MNSVRLRRCRQCQEKRDELLDFRVYRDGKWLATAICRYCIAAENVRSNREQKRKLK